MKKIFVGMALCAIVLILGCNLMPVQDAAMNGPLVGSWRANMASVTLTFTATRFTLAADNETPVNCDYTATANMLTFTNCSDSAANGTEEYSISGNMLTFAGQAHTKQ